MLSPLEVKELIKLGVSPSEIKRFLDNEETKVESEKIENVDDDKPKRWYEQNLCALDEDGLNRLKELEIENRRSSSSVEHKQLSYLKTMQGLKLEVPEIIKREVSPKTIYMDLKNFCIDNDIPSEIIYSLLPSVVQYIATGYMKPVIIEGEKGIGKTHSVKLFFNKALGLPVFLIKAQDSGDGKRSLSGDAATYKMADIGNLAEARIRNRSLVNIYLVDEIDKSPTDVTRGTCIADELLSLTDESISNFGFYDQYMQIKLVGLEHSPFIFTCNDINNVNPFLVDRCTVIRFPNPDRIRIESIIMKYRDKLMIEPLYKSLKCSDDDVLWGIETLFNRGIYSLRKYKDMLDKAFHSGLNEFFEQDSDEDEPVTISRAMFEKACDEICGTQQKKKVGF